MYASSARRRRPHRASLPPMRPSTGTGEWRCLVATNRNTPENRTAKRITSPKAMNCVACRARSRAHSLGNSEQGKRRRKEKRFRPRSPGIPRLIAKRRPAWRPSIGQTASGRAFSRVQEGRGDAQAPCFVVNTGHHDRAHSPNRSARMELWFRFAIGGGETVNGTVKETTKCFPPF